MRIDAEAAPAGRHFRTRALVGTARALGAAALLALIASCDGPGVLYTLATESPRSNSNLPDEATVTAVVSVGSHYYVAAGGMWRRAHTEDTWQPVGRPARDGSGDEPAQLLVLGLAATGDTMCAGTARGLYRAQAGESPKWSPASGVPATEQVLRVFTIPGRADEILAVTKPKEDETAYRVYRSDDHCLVFDPVAALRDVSDRPFDATYAFGEYWVTVGARLFRGAALADLAPAKVQPDGSGRFRGVFLNDSGDRLYVADESGRIHFSVDGQSWDAGRIEPPADDVEAVPLTLLTQIAGTILIGTEGFGFYQFEDGEPDDAQRGPRITSQLYEAHITGFAQFDRGRIVFAGTAVDGLSSIDVDKADGNFGTWNWE